ncbi:MAG: nucleotidyltransferase domain-containing protein [Ferruginibacter sp.]
MNNQNEILKKIKVIVHQSVPGAKIFLFGSRAGGKTDEESDWDILILTEKKYPKTMRWQIQDSLFSLSVKLHTYIDITLAKESEWNSAPEYYSLKLDIQKNKSLAL